MGGRYGQHEVEIAAAAAADFDGGGACQRNGDRLA